MEKNSIKYVVLNGLLWSGFTGMVSQIEANFGAGNFATGAFANESAFHGSAEHLNPTAALSPTVAFQDPTVALQDILNNNTIYTMPWKEVTRLILLGADPNVSDSSGNRLLHFLATDIVNGSPLTNEVRDLFEVYCQCPNANLNATNDMGITPLDLLSVVDSEDSRYCRAVIMGRMGR